MEFCNLCGHNRHELYVNVRGLKRTIEKCRQCGLVFSRQIDRSSLTFDFENRQEREQKYCKMKFNAEEKGRHDETILKREEYIRTLHFKSRKDKIDRYTKRGKLLDIGCGRGFFLLNFVHSNFDYVGVEPRERISQEARRRLGTDKILCGTLREVKFPDGNFDVVTMINVIEHLPFPRQTLAEVARIMKQGAVLLIETPNVNSLIPHLLGARWHAFLEPEHHYFFSKDTLTKMLNGTGFRVESTGRGNKLFSARYLIYRLNWYNKKCSSALERLFCRLRLLDKAVRVPQFDEFIMIAKKTMAMTKS